MGDERANGRGGDVGRARTAAPAAKSDHVPRGAAPQTMKMGQAAAGAKRPGVRQSSGAFSRALVAEAAGDCRSPRRLARTHQTGVFWSGGARTPLRAVVSREDTWAAALVLLVAAFFCLAVRGEAQAGTLRLEAGKAGWVLWHPDGTNAVYLLDEAPLFDFGDFLIGGTAWANWRKEESADETRWLAEWNVVEPRPARIRATLRLSPQDNLLRKTVEVCLKTGPPALLRSVLVDKVDVSGQSPTLQPGWQSYPVLCRAFFFGIEFPVATSYLSGSWLLLTHAPGKRLQPGEWFVSRTAVHGAAPPGESRRAFENYIRRLRPTPHGVHFNYNSWWTSPVPYSEADILKIIAQFRDGLFVPYGVSFDTFTIDMGWAKNTTLWQIDPALFAQGFTNLAKACAEIDSRPGLWISPSGVYGQALDLAWARTAGYEADTKACLGGPRYQAAFQQSLVGLATNYGLRQVKFDGYVSTCEATNHGHPLGPLSVEPIAEGIISVFTALRRQAPDLWMEPTCFGFNPSPWWLAYCNSVIGTFGDDAPHGRVPCPVYRESYTTGRDYYNLKGARDILCPIAAQEVLGIIHQTDEPLQNDAVVTVLRGHQFLPLYVHPDSMTPRRWEFLAALMCWARRNEAVLEHTLPIFPKSWNSADGRPNEELPGAREPYGYAHADGRRALICLRNPWILPATVTLIPSQDAGLPPAISNLAAVAVYPETEALATGLSATDPLRISLAPYETKVVEIRPKPDREDEGPGVPSTRLSPKLSEPKSSEVRQVKFDGVQLKLTESGPPLGSNYTRLLPGTGPYLRTRFSATLAIPKGGNHELLFLVESHAPLGGSAKVPPAVAPPLCRLTAKPLRPAVSANAAPAETTPIEYWTISSDSGWRATGQPAPERWLWLAAPCPAGENLIEGEITLTDPAQTLAAYVVDQREIPWQPLPKVDGTRLPPPESVYTAARELFHTGLSADLPSLTEAAPIERVNGVYLDALEPLSSKQGWGKLERNRSVWQKPFAIGGRGFARGLGTHAPAQIVYQLDGHYRRFTAWAGADQATAPTITMAVKVDGRMVWQSGLLTRRSPPQRVELSIAGAQSLELIVGDGGNGLSADHADWADAVLWE